MHFFGVGALPGDSRIAAVDGGVDAGDLRLFLQIVDAMEYRVLQRQLDRIAVGKDAFDLAVEVVPLVLAPEVVDHQEAAVQEVATQGGDFVVGECQLARLDQIKKRIVEQLGRSQIEDFALRIDLERSELLQSVGKVQI